jgi:hypothetical protein
VLRSRNRPRTEWVKDSTIVEWENDSGKCFYSLRICNVSPLLEDKYGNKRTGFPRINIELARDDQIIRFHIFDKQQLDVFVEMIHKLTSTILEGNLVQILKNNEDLYNSRKFSDPKSNGSDEEENKKPRPTGLSKYTNNSKTEKKKQKQKVEKDKKFNLQNQK